MRVGVRLFAGYREAVGRDRLEVEIPSDGTVEAAWSAVVAGHPELRRYRDFTLFAVGQEYVEPEYHLKPGDELCLFPPVAGGSSATTCRVVHGQIQVEVVAAAVTDPGAGAVVTFTGVVRNESGGRRVKFLEYEAHAPMAEAKLREIAETARTRWPGVRRVAIAHRVGRLEIGEASVVIAVSAAHRGEAFEACRYAIDTLKRTVPVWKKEHFEDGEVWVGLEGG